MTPKMFLTPDDIKTYSEIFFSFIRFFNMKQNLREFHQMKSESRMHRSVNLKKCATVAVFLA